jgi:hypothetical protein
MAPSHVIELALDLARMPALARSSVVLPLPPNVIELMRIAAASPEACQVAAAKTGEPTSVLIEAARFYLQQVLFRADADCYRILGIAPTASRATARDHMRWLMEWLHPDRNNDSWDGVYAERVLKAWREVSASHGSASRGSASHGSIFHGSHGSAARPRFGLTPALSSEKKRRRSQTIRRPWIERPVERPSLAIRSRYHGLVLWVVPAGLAVIFLALWSASQWR